MKNLAIRKISLVAVMAAVVFVSSQIQIPIPLGLSVTRVHIGNGFCLLCGLLLGPLLGGLSAGIGSCFFDLLNPIYLTSVPFTFIFKFLMAYICGKIAWTEKKESKSLAINLTGTILGAIIYIILYLSKSYIKDVFVRGIPKQGAIAALFTRGLASLTNAIVGVIIAIVLLKVLKPIINKVRE